MVKKCSNETKKTEALEKLQKRFRANGFRNVNVSKILNRQQHSADTKNKKVFLSLPFLGDKNTKQLKRILQNYDFPVQLVSKPAEKLSQCFHDKTFMPKHENCNLCNSLPRKHNCEDKFIVYEFTCKLCNCSYIGQTNRPFYLRYKEHTRSLDSKNKISALSEHALLVHPSENLTISDFTIDFLKQCRSPLETRISEAQLIDAKRPQLNRKLEKAHAV